jgi:hypothetical protein
MASDVAKVKELPTGCGYQGYEFGGGYLDSLCCGGRLYDCDDCDSQGNLYDPVEEIPCPICHPRKAVAYWTHRNGLGGLGDPSDSKAARSLVADIRRNRGVKPNVGGRP